MGKEKTYALMLENLKDLLEDDDFEISILANASALMMERLEGLNWVGFYLLRGKELLLGPFQGKVACTRIPLGKGVVGSSAERKESIVVPDVNDFPGYIACDEATKSEIVIPLFVKGRVYGVLDIDSGRLNRFSRTDLRYLEDAAKLIASRLEKIKLHEI
ncbi:MAG TPA: GAF domain-containing protein [Acholeplasmataceae bacterium]|jgi:L-methionine (R)-S-oxide reductase|nr:GAF domain-containing protein [Acholeplasmataceae bacterium]